MSRRRAASAIATPPPKRRHGLLLLTLLMAAGAVGLTVWASQRGARPKIGPAAVSAAPADACVSPPAFALRAGLRPPLLVDLRGKPGVKGFSLLEARAGGKSLRQPDWEAAGSVGSHTIDRNGHIYVAPTPFFRAGGGLAGLSNQFYRVDSATGRMAEFTRLPSDASPGPANPFGVTGLAHDCATDSLYAASVAGSGPRGEAGRIFQMDPATRAIRAEWRGVDALGLAVFGDRHGRRLYFGSARRSEIRSLPLDATGGFAGPPRLEARLAAQTGAAFDKAHTLRFYPDGRLEAKGVEFSYSLIVASDPQRNLYTFTRHATEDRWEFRDVLPQR